jgi:excisionase family DNA binding protein
MSHSELPRWRSVPAAATGAEVSDWLLRKEIREGRLRARRIGRLVRVLDEDLAEWMRGRDEAS